MNNAALNASGLNGPGIQGHNATLSGGVISISATLSALMLVGAVLSGGCETVSDAQGRVAAHLRGGAGTASAAGGGLRITTNLMFGIHSNGFVSSVMHFDPSMTGGVYSPSSFGGQIQTHVRLQQESQLGQSSSVGGGMSGDTALNDGVHSTSYLTGRLNADTVLMADGVKSTSFLDSDVMQLGQSLSDGVASSGTVGGTLHYPAFLRGGILATNELGKELDIEALLQGAVIQTTTVGGTWRISPVGNGGIESSASFGASQQLSPAANGGVGSSGFVSSTLKVSPKLGLGVSSSGFIGGKGITASQILREGVSSPAPVLGGQLKAQALLQGPIVSSAALHGDIVQGFRDPLLNTWALEIRSATVLLEVRHPISDT